MICPILLAAAFTTPVFTDAASIRTAAIRDLEQTNEVRLAGQVVANYFRQGMNIKSVLVKDATGGVCVRVDSNRTYRIGDCVRISGSAGFVPYVGNIVHARRFDVVRHGEPPPPADVEPAQIRSGAWDCQRVRIQGVAVDAFRDEIDPSWNWILLKSGETVVPVSSYGPDIPPEEFAALIDCELSVVGFCMPHYAGQRMFISTRIDAEEPGLTSIRTIRRPSGDLFDAPPFDPRWPGKSPHRRSLVGIVLAVWHGDRAFLFTDELQYVEIRFRPDAPMPSVGARIKAVGFVETDNFFARLVQAVHRPEPAASEQVRPTVREVDARTVLADETGARRVNTWYNGRIIRLTGTVRNGPSDLPQAKLTHLDCDGYLVPVDVTAAAGAADACRIGARLAVTGSCLMEFEDVGSVTDFPRIRGFSVILRGPDDIAVISRPSWWTSLRLLVVIGVLGLLLAAILLWNLALRIIAERRGRELFRENVARIGADLRTDERTRLAVDLHDSLAQMLTGVSLQIDAGNLPLASRSLQACRDELRNCLWDLRNQTLEDRDLGEAIRRTLKPHLGDAALVLRFYVPRAKLSDLTAHSVLMIVRELATNAVRHGKARTLHIAGSLDADELKFSVRDDGTGFDPHNRPGPAEGHFGLQGIRERVNRCKGALSIDSAPGRGTKVTISLKRQK